MKRSIRKKTLNFLVHVMEINDEVEHVKEGKVATKDVQLFLNEFKGVFLDEMNKLPLVREVDHVVDFISNATPIAKAPHSHSLTQNVELENQLNNFLNK